MASEVAVSAIAGPNPLRPLALTMVSEKPCTIHDNGKFYNLNPLTSKTDYALKSLGGHDFFLNVCQGVSHRLWNVQPPEPTNVAGFIRQDHGDFLVGLVNTTLDIRDSSPLLLLTSGSTCKGGQTTASTAIHFLCDTSVTGSGQPVLVSQSPQEDENACTFFLDWRTPVACPTSESTGFYGYFAFILASCVALIILYLVCGILYNRFVLKLSGFDQVPQFSLTSLKYHVSSSFESLTDIIRDFCQQSRDFRIRTTGWVPTNSNRNMNPNSHQWMHGGGDRGDLDVENTSDPRRQHFGLDRQTLSGTREERQPIIPSDINDSSKSEADGEGDSPSSTREGTDSEGVYIPRRPI